MNIDQKNQILYSFNSNALADAATGFFCKMMSNGVSTEQATFLTSAFIRQILVEVFDQ